LVAIAALWHGVRLPILWRTVQGICEYAAPFGGMWQAIVVKCLAGIALFVSSAACFDILMSGAKMLPLH
jgi:hypothetical protein